MKIIIDTNVYISAFCFDNLPDELIRLIELRDDFELYLSDEIFAEISDKFLSGRIEKILKHRYIKAHCQLFVQGLSEKGTFVTVPITSQVSICRDPKDDMLISLANHIDAEYIITGDKDLLVLGAYISQNNKTTKIITVQTALQLPDNKIKQA